MIKRLDNIGVAVTDVRRAVGFYREKLGLEGEAWSDDGGNVKIGDVSLFIFRTNKSNAVGRTPTFADNPVGVDHLAFEVDDLDQAISEMEGKGVVFVHDIVGEKGKFRYRGTQDPDGNMVFVIEKPA